MASPRSVSCAVTPVEYSFGLLPCQGVPGELQPEPRPSSIGAAMVEENETVEALDEGPPPLSSEAEPPPPLPKTPPPVIEALLTAAGPLEGGTPVVVQGSGFVEGSEVKVHRIPVKTSF